MAHAFAGFIGDVVARGDFTQRWFAANAAQLESALVDLEGSAARILEIGAFEGMSACYFLWRLPGATVTSIDTFEGSPGLPSSERRGLEDAFDRNVALVDRTRVRKLVGDSRRVLLDLVAERALFDLVYVDGSHRALDVLVDAALSWPLVRPGGVVVFDDYLWRMLGDDPLDRPGPAIDAFVALVSGHADLVARDRQVVLRKLGGEPAT